MPPGTDTVAGGGPAWITKEFLEEALRPEGAGGAGPLAVLQCDVQPAVGKGDNFLSTLYRVRAQYRRGRAPPSTAHLIVKGLPCGDFLLRFVHEAGFFTREINAYREVLPQLQRFAERQLGAACLPRLSPRCFHTARPDTLVLEDLAAQGFKMANRRNMLDLPHCRLVLNRLSRLHAISFAYSAQNPTFLNKFKDDIYTEMNRETFRQFLEPQMHCLVEVAQGWPDFEQIVEKIRGAIPGAVDKLVDVCRLQDTGWKVLNHGDCWVNNILFKYSPEGEAVDLRFVDFQIMRYASPALDLTYFLYSSPQSEVRARHMDALLQDYCDEFRRTAHALGVRCRSFTLAELQEEMRRVLFFGFTTSVGTLAAALAEPDQCMNLSEMTSADMASGPRDSPFYKLQSSARFREVFQQLLPYFDKMKLFD